MGKPGKRGTSVGFLNDSPFLKVIQGLGLVLFHQEPGSHSPLAPVQKANTEISPYKSLSGLYLLDLKSVPPWQN